MMIELFFGPAVYWMIVGEMVKEWMSPFSTMYAPFGFISEE
jgi:hypothetical protein